MEIGVIEERMKMTTIRIGGALFSDSFMATLISSHHDWNIIDRSGLELALHWQEARKSYQEGSIPIGPVILLPDRETSTGFVVLGAGHNERIQNHSPTLHGEISAIENADRQKPETYRTSVLCEFSHLQHTICD